ncbi:MAG: DUF1552 domain-containing protein [Acidobacteria bacterium]|nr:DUF1552 domain-containing protein [Acidobacteriota bacterium]
MAAPTPKGEKPTKRMAFLYMPNGTHPDFWTPQGVGRDFQLSKTLEPLAKFRDDLTIVTNTWNAGSKTGDGHYVKVSGFLTSTTITKTLGVDVNCNGVSVDQLAAQRTAGATPLASLELGTSPVTTGVDRNVGYTRVYGSHIAWAGPARPLAREINPLYVYERLFRATRPAGENVRRDTDLLDTVLDDASQLRGRLGKSDQLRMDEYLEIVRSLEERLKAATLPGRASWQARYPIDKVPKPEPQPKDFADCTRLMMDMIALAFRTDTTRIATFMFGNEVTNQNFSFLPGISSGHHDISHHQNDPEKLKQYQMIGQWHIEQYAYLLSKLREIKEGDSNVLDQSMILFGAGIRNGDQHDPHNLPIVVAGKAGGRLAGGQHLSYAEDTPLANLYLSMLDAFDTPVERFADSTGRLPGVLA